jgi:two-component system LytT family response regulator
MRIRYLIVDDEAPGRVNLRLALGAHPDWILAAECDSAASARAALAAPDAGIDAIFLDVQMPVESGLLLARDVVRMPEPPLIVFVTAYSEHAIDAFEVHALDYRLKPVSDARLAQTVARCAAMLRRRQRESYGAAVRGYVDANVATQAAQPRHATHLSVRSVGRIEQVCTADILWIEAAGNYVELHLATRTVLHRITLNRLEALLDPAHFLRVHRGAIVRRDQIGALETIGDGSYRLLLRCGGAVAVSERHAGALKAAIAGPITP